MQIGVIFPQLDISADPGPVRDYAQGAEGLGFTHITAFDQVVGLDRTRFERWPYVHDHEDLFHEVFVLFGFLAGLTSRIGLATGVLVLPQRQTALVAKQAAEVDVLSGGRLRLGIGVGIKPEEFEALEIAYPRRGRRCEEQMALLRALWANEVVDYEAGGVVRDGRDVEQGRGCEDRACRRPPRSARTLPGDGRGSVVRVRLRGVGGGSRSTLRFLANRP